MNEMKFGLRYSKEVMRTHCRNLNYVGDIVRANGGKIIRDEYQNTKTTPVNIVTAIMENETVIFRVTARSIQIKSAK